MTLVLKDWNNVPAACNRDQPGVGHKNPRVMDLSQRATTADQLRIEAALDSLVMPQARILHVGVGNSSLALRWQERNVEIVGLTVNQREMDHANGLQVSGYRTRLANKYSTDLDAIDGEFDFIIDNNPASFGCCVLHFEKMLGNYARLLRPRALMVTDRKGMYWCYGNGPMRLTFDDLQTIANSYPFSAKQLTSDVFALQSEL